MEKDEVFFVNFQQISNISNARWNSRAIIALLTFILMPETRIKLRKVCLFIFYQCSDHWFSNHLFRNEDFDELSDALNEYPKGIFKIHLKRGIPHLILREATNDASVR